MSKCTAPLGREVVGYSAHLGPVVASLNNAEKAMQMLHDPAVYPNPGIFSPEHILEIGDKARNETRVDVLSVLSNGNLSLSLIAFQPEEHDI